MTRWRPSATESEAWIPWIRVLAVPVALADVALEGFPDGEGRWAWTLAAAFALGAITLLALRGTQPLLALAFDLVVISGFVVLYGFEPSSPVRQLFVLTALEGAVVLGRRGAVAAALASSPALAVFEWRAADRLDVAFAAGHVLGPVGIQLLVGLAAAALASRRNLGSGSGEGD